MYGTRLLCPRAQSLFEIGSVVYRMHSNCSNRNRNWTECCCWEMLLLLLLDSIFCTGRAAALCNECADTRTIDWGGCTLNAIVTNEEKHIQHSTFYHAVHAMAKCVCICAFCQMTKYYALFVNTLNATKNNHKQSMERHSPFSISSSAHRQPERNVMHFMSQYCLAF